ncbi:hypothetical protein [uncultured Vibrio sp.]|uniref:hypothetical protein n=1 Tax=uncultured Vibrio sp. TaxID=114054 RepID=UPI002634EC16|nr:hypothetical protein [uncultured Vibrio sp.]
MKDFIFESPFPTTKQGLLNLVFLDKRRIFECAGSYSITRFKLLSEDEKATIAKFRIFSNGEVSVELHDAVEASVIIERMGWVDE